GGAGIIALGSTNKGNVIPGVAIATALMPPLCTAGYGLATWQPNYFFGATYLFIINSIYIAFATFIGVKLMKYKGAPTVDTARAIRVRRIVYTLAILTMLPSIYLTYNMLRQSKFTTDADKFVSAECRFPDTQVLQRSAKIENGRKQITITLIGRALDADSLKMALDEKLRFYGLAGANLTIIQGGSFEKPNTEASPGITDIYRLAQSTISRQQTTIDSLRALISDARQSVEAAPEVAPEIKVIFPGISRIGISTTVFCNPSDSARTDTANVALVHSRHRLSNAERQKLADYLEARLGYRKVEIVEL
ncbi:MAG: DUF389 domain-containing protein, partial [Muribaculaceae bacterium]|nr:DUF389 domain-containing protein [Muribaculaceae bacterium]